MMRPASMELGEAAQKIELSRNMSDKLTGQLHQRSLYQR
jgi:hypothetical protein